MLSQKPSFVNPFIIACGTKNPKFTSIAIVCLQRLIVARALPEAKLDQVLEALMQASSAGLDVQLKILQALPSLLQNYSSQVQGDLLVTALNICFILQSSKNAIVNNTSAATLQQLVVSVFDKVVMEDSEYQLTSYFAPHQMEERWGRECRGLIFELQKMVQTHLSRVKRPQQMDPFNYMLLLLMHTE